MSALADFFINLGNLILTKLQRSEDKKEEALTHDGVKAAEDEAAALEDAKFGPSEESKSQQPR